MKNKLKLFLRWAIIFVLCFVLIYLPVFLGGWKLFQSGNPILIELGVALVLSFFVFMFNEIVTDLEKRVKALEEQLEKYQNKK
jgi:low affinity Fe/Cu permease